MMNNTVQSKSKTLNQESLFDLRTLFEIFTMNWKWFFLSVFVCVGVTYFYVHTLPFDYQRSAVLLVKDENQLSSDKVLEMMSPTGESKTGIENELYTLSSNQLVSEVVHRLNLEVNYTQKEGLRTTTLYEEVPFSIHFLDTFNGYVAFDVVAFDAKGIEMSNFSTETDKKKSFKLAYNDTVQTPVGAMVVLPSVDQKKLSLNKVLHIERCGAEAATDRVRQGIVTSPVAPNATLVRLVCSDGNVSRADAILKTLMEVYRETLVADKNKEAANTAKFIDERILIISEELGDVENRLTKFKQTHGIVNIESKAATSMEEGSQAKARSVELNAQLNVAVFVRNFVTDASKRNDLIPNVSGIGDAGVQNQIQSYNELLLRRNRLMENSGEGNSVVQELNKDLEAMRATISGSLNTYCNTLSLQIKDARHQEVRANQSISSIPVQEKKVLDVMRQQKIKESLYTILLETRERIAMQLAATEANIRVVEKPHGSRFPVDPQRRNYLLYALLLGLGLPFGVVILRRTLDTGVRGRKDIERYTTIPFLGNIPSRKEQKDEKIVISEKTNDHITEAFRLLRTNVNFFQRDARVLMFTSTMSHEGKSFISRNFAVSLALAGNKVILVDTDIRKGQQGKLLSCRSDEGVSTYLNGTSTHLHDLIIPRIVGDKVDFLPSGAVPPNPSELLMNSRLEEMFAILRQEYDYIVVDNVPALLIADATIVNRIADVTLYVIREGMVDRRYLPELEQLHQDKKFKNMGIILNDVKERSRKYGYGNGYGYYEEGSKKDVDYVSSRKSFLKRLFGRK